MDQPVTKEQVLYNSTDKRGLEQSNSETESRKVVLRDGEAGSRVIFNGASVWEDEKALDTGAGDGWTTM